MRKLLTKEDVTWVIEQLLDEYPDARAELNYRTPFELLIATILSAQCTDIRVNQVTKELFQVHNTPQAILSLGEEDLREVIKSCGFYNAKAKNIIACSKMLLDCYGGEVPKVQDELIKLPGVARKTANVVVSNVFDIPAIAVDTHVFRLANRIGLANDSDVLKTEQRLMKRIPKKQWTHMHHALILHGRRVCKARKPLCEGCRINTKCLWNQRKG